jgi:zinc/manganese transport system substrate-binding protein
MRKIHCLLLILAGVVLPAAASAKVRVAASITDLASIASSVGGGEVEAFSIARPNADVHRVEVLPSYMVKVTRAQIYLKVGLGLDQWADHIIDGSRNTRLAIVDCSRDVNVLEKPTGKVDASMGDVHPNGNPHYWLDPRNGAAVARTVADALAKADPDHAGDYRARAEAFASECQSAWERGRSSLSGLSNRTLITYHASWPYFAKACDLEVVGTVEPVPGIPPTGRHLADLVSIIKARKVPVLFQEPYFSTEAGRFLNREAGIRVASLAPSCEGSEAGLYLKHFDDLVRATVGSVP